MSQNKIKVDIYLDDFDVTNFLVDEYFVDPISIVNSSKEYIKNKYATSASQVLQAIKNKIPVIVIKNVCKKFYKVVTPYDGNVQLDTPKDLIYRMFGLIGIIGTYPILYADENKKIIRVVAPRKGSYDELSSQSPFTDLDWHVDAAYRPMFKKNEFLSPMPDYLVFGVIHKGHEQLPITYIAFQDVINELSNDDILTGLSPEFSVLSADSFKNKIISKNVSLFFRDKEMNFYNRTTFKNTIPQTKRAEYLLQKMRSIVDQPHIQNTVNVESGDIIILNNKTTLHKRDSYKPKWDGKDRYFIRIYSVENLNQGILNDTTKVWEWT